MRVWAYRSLVAASLLMYGACTRQGHVHDGRAIQFASVDQDLGEQLVGTRIVGRFEFRNVSERSASFFGVESSCDCEQVAVVLDGQRLVPKRDGPPIAIAAGVTGSVEVVLTVKARPGSVAAELRVLLSDDRSNHVGLRLTFRPVPRYVVQHGSNRGSYVDLGVIDPSDHGARFSFWLESGRRERLEITAARGIPEGLLVDFQPCTSLKTRWMFRVGLGTQLAANSRAALVRCSVRRDSIAEAESLDVPVNYEFHDDVVLFPSVAMLGAFQAQDGVVVPITISSRKGASLSVARVVALDPSPPGLRPCTSVAYYPGRTSAEMRICIRPGAPKGRVSGKIHVFLGSGSGRAYQIRYFGFSR